jgi:ubiquinone biosynthesis monooxygenase Coq7
MMQSSLSAGSSWMKSPYFRYAPKRLFATETPSFDFENIRNEILACWMTAEAESPNGSQTRATYCCFTYYDAVREYKKPRAKWHWLDRELSSNIAGETGAVHIYKGALAAMTIRSDLSEEAQKFCKSHMANESSHLSLFQSIVPDGKYTRLLPIWRLCGWAVGFLPTMFGGSKALYVTVEAVETFVEEHFQEQIVPLKKKGASPELVRLLEHCCADEVHHKEDAVRHLLDGDKNFDAWWVRPWSSVVRTGSIFAADVARRI